MTTFPPLEVILAFHDIPSTVLDPLIISSSISVIWVIFWFFAYLFMESIDIYFAEQLTTTMESSDNDGYYIDTCVRMRYSAYLFLVDWNHEKRELSNALQ